MNTTAALKTYAKVGIESSIAGADPHKLITLLFEGALQAIANARNNIMHKNIPAKAISLARALAIIDEGLNASLNTEAGGELANKLASLYQYMVVRLVEANSQNDVAALDEVTQLLTDLHGAWNDIRPEVIGSPKKAIQPATNMQFVNENIQGN